MEFIIVGIVTALNLIFIKNKLELKRYEDAAFDFILLTVITVVFSNSYGGLVVGMVASLVISIYFYATPPKFITSIFSSLRAQKGSSNLPPFGPIRNNSEEVKTSTKIKWPTL